MPIDPELLKKLLNTFKTELEEQLQVIISGLLALEKNNLSPENANEMIISIFRSAHNIKGTSRSLGITNVSEIAHHIESLFSAIQKSTIKLTPEVFDVGLEAVDKMRLAMQAYLEKTDLSYNLTDFLSKLTDIQNMTPVSKETASSSVRNQTKNLPEVEKEKPEERISSEKKSSDTVRVSIENINRISSLMEDIQVNKIAMDDYYKQIINLHKNSARLVDTWKQLQRLLNPDNQTNDMYKKLEHQGSDLITENVNVVNELYSNMRSHIDELSQLSEFLQDEVRTLRLLPADYLLYAMPRLVRDLSREMDKKVDLIITGQDVKIDKVILENIRDPLVHLLRNSIDHGIESSEIRKRQNKPETATINIDVREEQGQILISVHDDGAGIDIDKVKQTALNKQLLTAEELSQLSENELLELIFKPGFSTKDTLSTISGRGIGLDVVRTNIENIKGHVQLSTEKGKGTTFQFWLPLTLVSEKGLAVRAGGMLFVLPINTIQSVLSAHLNEILTVQGRQALVVNKETLVLYSLTDILGIEQKELPQLEQLPVVIIKSNRKTAAFIVDEVVGEHDIVIKPFQPPLNKVRCISGGTLYGNNEVVLVLDATDLLSQSAATIKERLVALSDETSVSQRPSILVVDDSITTRTLEKNILESKNYNVTTAVNGKEAWEILQNKHFNLLITDVTMPIMDGFTLTEKVKKSDKLKTLPVIIVTSLGSDQEKKRGIDVGADAYIVKSDFESGALLNIIEQLV